MQSFYNSKSWDRVRQYIRKRDGYLCQECKRYGKRTTAKEVHHVNPLKERPDLALDERNLLTLCLKCHAEMDDRLTGGLTKKGEELRNRTNRKYGLKLKNHE